MLVLTLFIEGLCNGSAAFVVGPNAGLLAPGSLAIPIPYVKGFATVGFCAPAIRTDTHGTHAHAHAHACHQRVCVC